MTDEDRTGREDHIGQASPGDVAGFAPDRAARDMEGEFRPARLDPANGTEVNVLMPDGVSWETGRNEPAVILRLERLMSPVVTYDGLPLPWRIGISTVTGQRSSLPQHIVRSSDLEVYGDIRRLPETAYGRANYDLTFAVEPMRHLEASGPESVARSPYLDVESTLAHVFERTGFVSPDGLETAAWIWRCQARRYELSQPVDFAALHLHPELDDAIGRPHTLNAYQNMVAVPLKRLPTGLLYSAVSTRPGEREVTTHVDSYAERDLEPRGASALEAAVVMARGLEEINIRMARSKQAAEELEIARDRALAQHQQDIEILGSALIREAEDRSWCSEYDEFVENVNRQLHIGLRPRRRDYEVEVRVTATVYVTVEAKNEDEARDNVTSGQVRRALREWDGTIDSDDWSIEDVNEKD